MLKAALMLITICGTLLLAGEAMADAPFEFRVKEDGTLEIVGSSFRADEPDGLRHAVPGEIGGRAVTSIGPGAFRHRNLLHVSLPESIREIGANPFAGNDLRGISVAPGNRHFKVDNGVLFSADGSRLVAYPARLHEGSGSAGKYRHYSVPSGVRRIEPQAFSDAVLLESIDLPGGLLEIGDEAFGNCQFLMRIEIPGSVRKLGINLFEGCTHLTSVTVRTENSCFKVVDRALLTADGKTLLEYLSYEKDSTEYTLPPQVEHITDKAFYLRLQNRVRRVILPTGLRSIGREAFTGAHLAALRLPESLQRVDDKAFSHVKLDLLELTADIPQTGADIFGRAEIGRCVIGKGVTNFNAALFKGIPRPRIELERGNRQYRLEDGALLGNGGRTLVFFSKDPAESQGVCTVPEGVTSLGPYALAGAGLAELTLPESLEHIGAGALDDWWLHTLTVKAKRPPDAPDLKFSEIPAYSNPLYNLHIFVPPESLEAYKQAPGWRGQAWRIFPIGAGRGTLFGSLP